MKLKELYIYRIEDIAIGIVKADSEENAREMVINAYLQHYREFYPEYATIQIDNVLENGNSFEDFPDVVEIADMD